MRLIETEERYVCAVGKIAAKTGDGATLKEITRSVEVSDMIAATYMFALTEKKYVQLWRGRYYLLPRGEAAFAALTKTPRQLELIK